MAAEATTDTRSIEIGREEGSDCTIDIEDQARNYVTGTLGN
jgi:hypothetical protein